jgi:uncharacterized protein YukE
MPVRPDAQGMRHAAAQFRSKGDRVAVVLSRLDGQLASMVYAGPAADQFRAAVNWERDRLRQILNALVRVADVLNEGAARVEADPMWFSGSQGTGGTP